MFFIVEDLSEDALAVLEEKHKIDKEGTFGDIRVHISDTNVLPLRGIHPKTRKSAATCLAVIKPISGRVRIACSGLMITSSLQVVNGLAAS